MLWPPGGDVPRDHKKVHPMSWFTYVCIAWLVVWAAMVTAAVFVGIGMALGVVRR